MKKIMTVFLCVTIAVLTLTNYGCNSEASPTTMPPLDDGVKGTIIEVSCEEFAATPHFTKSIEIKDPGSLVVSLCTNLSTGYQWEEVKIGDEAVIQQTDRNLVTPESAGTVGSPGKDVWSFNSKSKGTSTLIFEYSRSWEGGENEKWTIELTVSVK